MASKYLTEARRALRNVLVAPDQLALVSAPDGRRFLTDRYVILSVRDFPSAATVCAEASDGAYSLTLGAGLARDDSGTLSGLSGTAAAKVYDRAGEAPDDAWKPVSPTSWGVYPPSTSAAPAVVLAGPDGFRIAANLDAVRALETLGFRLYAHEATKPIRIARVITRTRADYTRTESETTVGYLMPVRLNDDQRAVAAQIAA